MAYRFRKDGVVECDSLDELLALRDADAQRAAPVDASQSIRKFRLPSKPKVDSPALVERWRDFLGFISGKQLLAVRTLKQHPHGLTAHELIPKLGVKDVNGVVGVLAGGVFKNVAKAGLKLNQVIDIHIVKGVKRYAPGPLLLSNEVPEAEGDPM